MNHDRTDPRLLELATSCCREPGELLDPETAELREGWLALGDLLARHPVRDNSAFAARLAAELSAAPVITVRSKGRWAVVGALTAVAAAALVAISIWTAGKPASRDDVVAGHLQNPVLSGAEEAADWDDPLDGQIASLQEQLGPLAGSPPGLDASLSALNQQLAELADDLDAGSL